MGICTSRERDASDSDTHHISDDKANNRVMRFWWNVGPMIMHYKLAKIRSWGDEADLDARYERLHAHYAPEARRLVEEFGGLFVKGGQALSTRPELAPAAFIAELRKLQSEVPPARWEPIRESLERDLGAPIEKLFEHIQQDPLGSASIGQAHLVRWRGRDAVVKVQYPGVRQIIRADLMNIEMLCRMANPEALPVLKRVCEQFENELDYSKEQHALRGLHEAISAAPEFAGRVVVPAPIKELTSGNVIGMEYLPGPKLETALRERLEALGINIASVKDMILQQQQQMNASDTDAPPKLPGDQSGGEENSKVSASGASTASPFRRIGRAALRLIGVDGALWLARVASDVRMRCRCRRRGQGPSTDLRAILRLVLNVHGFQIFFCPAFNSDPHPGNILLLPDGRVGLIDFGLCTQVTSEQKRILANLFVACAESPPFGVSQEADDRVREAVQATGLRTQKSDPDVLALFPRLAFCKIQPEWVDRRYVKEIMERDIIVDMPVHLLMAMRCAGLLRGFCLGLQENVSVAEAWRPYAERWLRENAAIAH